MLDCSVYLFSEHKKVEPKYTVKNLTGGFQIIEYSGKIPPEPDQVYYDRIKNEFCIAFGRKHHEYYRDLIYLGEL